MTPAELDAIRERRGRLQDLAVRISDVGQKLTPPYVPSWCHAAWDVLDDQRALLVENDALQTRIDKARHAHSHSVDEPNPHACCAMAKILRGET